MAIPTPAVGDHLVVQHFCYTHHGVYVGNGQVIHYQGPFSGDGFERRIILSTLDDFHGNQPLQVMAHPNRPFSREAGVARAFSRLSEHDYHLLFNNCEHFVLWCIEGQHDSPQVNNASTALAATGTTLLKSGHRSQTAVSGLVGASAGLASAPVASSTILSVTAISAPAWAPLAVGITAAYGAHRLFKWLTED